MNEESLEFPQVEEDFSSSLMGMLDSMGDRMSPEGRIVFHCTLDDIGSCGKDGIQGCVGYVAQKDQWNRFNSQWDYALDGFGLTYLHTSKFLHGADLVGPQRTENDDYTILRPFITVVQQQLLDPEEGFGVIVFTDCAGYEALSEAEKRVIRPPLRHSFEILIGAVCGTVSPVLSRANPIAFEVDETDVPETASDLLSSFIYLKKQNDLYRKSLGGLCFVDDKMLRAAQAADMLGNMALKGWRKRITQGAEWPPALKALVSRSDGTIRVRFLYHDTAVLKQIAADRIARHQKITQVADINSTGKVDEPSSL